MESLPTVFRRALLNLSKAFNLPTIQDETQELIDNALNDCNDARTRVATLGVFSPNETLDDISTRDLVYLFLPYVSAEIEGRARTIERDERLSRLGEAKQGFTKFVADLELYEIVSKSDHELHGRDASAISDPARRRETKIMRYRAEKELRARIETIATRHRVPLPSADTSPTDFDLIAALLPPPVPASFTVGDDEDDEDEKRTATLLLLRLAYVQAHAQLASITQELELLFSVPPAPSQQPWMSAHALSSRESERAFWTLDRPHSIGTAQRGGPLLDSAGKPLQPFTILPHGAGGDDRTRLREQVFQPDHRLPTMTIDEYLEIERQRGNILTGGGPQSAANPTSSEQLTMDAEQDGTAFGDAKSEEKREKDEEWAIFTDANPRGAGNTMNRG